MLRSLLNGSERKARLARDGGWRGVLRREIRSKRLKLYGRTEMVFLADDLTEPPPWVPVPDGLEIEPFTGSDLEAFRDLAGPAQRRKFAERLAAGRRLLVARRNGEIIGFTWINGHRSTMAMDGMTLNLPDGWCYAYGLYVHPGGRGGGIGTALTNARMHYARELGCQRICRMVRVRNAPALRSAAKAKGSTEPAGTATLYHMFGRKWVRWTSPPP